MSLEMIKKGLKKINMINNTISIRVNKTTIMDHLENTIHQLKAIIETDEIPESKLTIIHLNNFERELREIKNATKEEEKT